MMPTNPQVMQWLDIAQKDYDVAKHLYDAFRPMPLEIICYQSQQAGEKALKAVYIFLNIPGGVPKTHDLTMLLNQVHHAVAIPPRFLDAGVEITPYASAARYPSEAYFDEHGAGKALQCAEQLLVWAKGIILADHG